MIPNSRDLLTIEEVADSLRLSVTSIYRLISSRSIPFIRVGGRKIRIQSDDIHKYIQRNRVESRDTWHYRIYGYKTHSQ